MPSAMRRRTASDIYDSRKSGAADATTRRCDRRDLDWGVHWPKRDQCASERGAYVQWDAQTIITCAAYKLCALRACNENVLIFDAVAAVACAPQALHHGCGFTVHFVDNSVVPQRIRK